MGEEERQLLSLVMRGDRAAPSESWIAWVRSGAENLGLEVHVVVQVERDAARGEELAAALGGHVVQFASSDHAIHEAKVRSIYRRSLITIGDRLHGLIVAASEGSVPIGWVETSTGKIAAHFNAVGLEYVGAREGWSSSSEPLTREWVRGRERELRTRIDDARKRLISTESALAVDAVALKQNEGSRR
ncbi:hypothetical protein QT381_12985 [Galbitalea sp. SE-J8]|uniref:hypothetical protein n=1 Tax=Galbitalea sp. SE-J8 TaxID=3054952 RepID=UPI00259CBEC0|nr:hypothetical protein [Galbitalea sp. SE-J8]MDM4763922.1 hypothetical protein [Galbitalea sp. SE-J8]